MTAFTSKAASSLPQLLSSTNAALLAAGVQEIPLANGIAVARKAEKLDGFSKRDFLGLIGAAADALDIIGFLDSLDFDFLEGDAADSMKEKCETADDRCYKQWEIAIDSGACAEAVGETVECIAEDAENKAGGTIEDVTSFLTLMLPFCRIPGAGKVVAELSREIVTELLECVGSIFDDRNQYVEECFDECSVEIESCKKLGVDPCPALAVGGGEKAEIGCPQHAIGDYSPIAEAPQTQVRVEAPVEPVQVEAPVEPAKSVEPHEILEPIPQPSENSVSSCTETKSQEAAASERHGAEELGKTIHAGANSIAEALASTVNDATRSVIGAVEVGVQVGNATSQVLPGVLHKVTEAALSQCCENSGFYEKCMSTAADWEQETEQCGSNSPDSQDELERPTTEESAPAEHVAEAEQVLPVQPEPMAESAPEDVAAPKPTPKPVPAAEPEAFSNPECASEPESVSVSEPELEPVPDPELVTVADEEFEPVARPVPEPDAGSEPKPTHTPTTEPMPKVETNKSASVEVPSAGEW